VFLLFLNSSYHRILFIPNPYYMKNILLFLPILCWGTSATAQGVFSNQTNFILEKVVQDYPGQFKNIRGELVSSGQGQSAYKSTLVIPGAISTTITETNATQKQVCWQSVLYTNTEFATAKNRFETLFNQIKNTIIKPEGEKPVIVNGLFMNPSAEKTYNTIQFDLLPPAGITQKINIDLVMQHSGNQWQILLSVYDMPRKENGEIVVK